MTRTRKNTTKVNNKTRTYKRDDYNSNDGMLTSVWGPSLWHVLHSMSFNYPVNPSKLERQHYRDFILSLKWTLPCGKCRTNLVNNLKSLPLEIKHMKSRDAFSRYVYDLHEVVNTMLKKKSGLSYEDIRERYEHFRARCTESVKEYDKRIKKKIETGCLEPLYGKKSKCILKIIPDEEKCESIQIDDKCIKKSTID
jgi:hypothetical protein